jgi:hypothetical protein
MRPPVARDQHPKARRNSCVHVLAVPPSLAGRSIAWRAAQTRLDLATLSSGGIVGCFGGERRFATIPDRHIGDTRTAVFGACYGARVLFGSRCSRGARDRQLWAYAFGCFVPFGLA